MRTTVKNKTTGTTHLTDTKDTNKTICGLKLNKNYTEPERATAGAFNSLCEHCADQYKKIRYGLTAAKAAVIEQEPDAAEVKTYETEAPEESNE